MKRCFKCGKLIWFNEVKTTVDGVVAGQEIKVSFHEKCYLKHKLEEKDRKFYKLFQELNNPNRINEDLVQYAKQRLDSLNGICIPLIYKKVLYMSVDVFECLCEEISLRKLFGVSIANGTLAQSLNKEIELFGMEVIIDDTIQGWYIKQVKEDEHNVRNKSKK